MKKTFVSNEPKISIKYDGKGDLLILLHGIGGNKDNWDLNFSTLSKHFLCVAWDTRGYGESEDYKGELLFEDVINDLLSIYKKYISNEDSIYFICRFSNKQVTINTKAPLVVNLTSKTGYQPIIDHDDLKTNDDATLKNTEEGVAS